MSNDDDEICVVDSCRDDDDDDGDNAYEYVPGVFFMAFLRLPMENGGVYSGDGGDDRYDIGFKDRDDDVDRF